MGILNKALMALTIAGFATCQTPSGCGTGKRNNAPVLDIPAVPLKTVTNGQSWIMKEGTNVVYIAKLNGNAYEMGHAFGELYGAEIAQNLENLHSYLRAKVTDFLTGHGVPSSTANMIADKLEPVAYYLADLNWSIVLPYTPQRYIDEFQGIVDGSNGAVSMNLLIRANMLPEITQAACTIVGVWGVATADNQLYHLRALDWEPQATVNQFPSIIIYDSTEEGSKTFANIGYMGLTGTLTAISKIGISVGEKVMFNLNPGHDYPIDPRVTYYGKPWNFVLRDTVQFANNLADVETMLTNANRTMQIHLGFGSLPDNQLRGVNYASNFVQFFDDKNYYAYSDAHPQLDGVFFLDKGCQPSGSPCVGTILSAQHGKVTPETLYRDIAGYHTTGNAQMVVMDPLGQQVWLSYSEYNSTVNAYERSPIHVDLSQFWGKSSSNFLA